MAQIFFFDQLRTYTGGLEQVTLEPKDYRDLLRLLAERFPGIDQAIEQKAMVAIDEEIIYDPYLEKITPTSEVHFLVKINAG